MALSQAGFAMAQAASENPRAGFLGALAAGGTKGTVEFMAAMKDYKATQDKLDEARYSLAQADENRKYDMSKEAAAETERQRANYETLYGHFLTANARLASTQISSAQLKQGTALAIAQMRMQAELTKPQRQLDTARLEAFKAGDTKALGQLQMLEMQSNPQLAAAALSSARYAVTTAEKELADAQLSPNKAARDTAQQALQQAREYEQMLMQNLGAPKPSTAPTNNYAGWGNLGVK